MSRVQTENLCRHSPVGAPGRVAGVHFRRAQPPQFAHGCTPTGEAPPRLLLRRTELIPFFPFRWFRLSEPIDRRGRIGMNSVLRLPGYGSWGRARTGPWLRTNWPAPTPFPRETPKNKEFSLTSTFQKVILLWMDCPGPCPVLTGVILFYGPPHLLF